MEENREAIEKENQKKEIPLMFLDAENNEKAISDIELFRQKHRDVRIVVYDESEVDLTETIKSYLNALSLFIMKKPKTITAVTAIITITSFIRSPSFKAVKYQNTFAVLCIVRAPKAFRRPREPRRQ